MVTSCQPATGIAPLVSLTGSSARLLIQALPAFALVAQVIETSCASADAPNKRTIQAFPSSLGFMLCTSTSGEDNCSMGSLPSAASTACVTTSDWVSPVAKRSFSADEFP